MINDPFFSEQAKVKVFLTERSDGNMALHVGDDPQKVIARRKKLTEYLGVHVEKMTFMDQVHGNHVAVVKEDSIGKGVYDVQDAFSRTDAMITNVVGNVLVTQVADCAAVLLYDPVRKVVGVAHAGWRGTVKRIAQGTIRNMTTRFDCDPKDILVGIGPAIGPCCFAIGGDVIREVENNRIAGLDQQKRTMDLWKANEDQLLGSGVLEENIESVKKCTFCDVKTWYSYRREGAKAGRMAIGIVLVD